MKQRSIKEIIDSIDFAVEQGVIDREDGKDVLQFVKEAYNAGILDAIEVLNNTAKNLRGKLEED